MNSSALGGGILFATIALLWIAVLVPSIARGREFRAAEQNAARLQRTLRILAETAAIPEEHYVEATAREALAQEKKLKAARKHFEQVRKQELQMERAKLRVAEMRNQKELESQQDILRRERLRSKKFQPLRKLAAFITLLGFAGIFVGLIGALASWFSWSVLLTAIGAAFLGFSTLVLLAPGARKKVLEDVKPVHVFLPEVYEPVQKQTVEENSSSHEQHLEAQAKAALELERSRVMAQVRAQARARAASQKPATRENVTGTVLLREAGTKQHTVVSRPVSHAESKATESAAPLSLSDRLKNMGVVEDAPSVNVTDLLERRRNAS